MRLTVRAARDDAGFTLIELLLVVVILGIIVIPLGNALIAYFRNTDATSARMTLSHDAQISAAYLDLRFEAARDHHAVFGNGLERIPAERVVLAAREHRAATGSTQHPREEERQRSRRGLAHLDGSRLVGIGKGGASYRAGRDRGRGVRRWCRVCRVCRA